MAQAKLILVKQYVAKTFEVVSLIDIKKLI